MDAGSIGESLGRAVMYLVPGFVVVALWLMYIWGKEAAGNVKALVINADGDGDYVLLPKTGNSISLKKPNSNTTELWPISELSTVSVPHPGIGFLPKFMQPRIRLTVVHEKDWEPVLNLSQHHVKVMSPDMVAAIQELIDNLVPLETEGEESALLKADLRADLEDMLIGVSTGPSREMIASPAVLGNLLHEKVSEVAIAVYKDVLDPLKAVINKMNQLLSPQTFYLVSAIIIIAVAALGVFSFVQVKSLQENQAIMMHAQGILTAEEQAAKAAAEAAAAGESTQRRSLIPLPGSK